MSLETKKYVPLSKAVKAAIVDTYEQISDVQQRYTHWAARLLHKLQRETIKAGKKKVLIGINQNTKTGTLPLGFERELFVGFINDRGEKVALKLNSRSVDLCSIEEIAAENKCTVCHQDKAVCDDLSVTEDVSFVVFNDQTYENKVVKKLYPNGDYYLETTTWFLDVDGITVTSRLNKEFMTNLELKPCGCLDNTPSNLEKLKDHCYGSYACNFCNDYNGVSEEGYSIHEETGLIRVGYRYPHNHVYLEYLEFMAKKNGQYVIPAVAFETIVEGIKYMAIRNKKGVENWRIQRAEESYRMERKNMYRVLGRVSLSFIINAFRQTPKFNAETDDSWYSNFGSGKEYLGGLTLLNRAGNAVTISDGSGTGGNGGGGIGGGSGGTVINNTTIINNGSYQLRVKVGSGVGHPVEGESVYQNNLLKKATDINFIILGKLIFEADLDFTFTSATGEIALLNGMQFALPDSLIIPYNKTN